MVREIVLVRHGETEWSLSGAHTGRTDIPLTAAGESRAVALGESLLGSNYALVLTSPLVRARETCRLAGFTGLVDPNLREWDYGDYEGRTTAEIRALRPDWSLWRDGAPNGEAAADVAERARAVIARVVGVDGDVLLFSHGHLLRVLAACWLGLACEDGRLFALSTGSVSRLGFERDARVIQTWNGVGR